MNDRINIRVLIIDDEEAVCRRLREWLGAARYDVVTFTRPEEALENAAKVAYHAALVDLRLADRDGAEVIAALRGGSPSMCILAMAAFPEVPQILAAFRAGARDLIEKPVQETKLLAVLEHQLARDGVIARDEGEFNHRLGARLRFLRQKLELTINDVASSADITPAQLSQIETGKTGTTAWTLARLCAAMKVTLKTVFEGV